MNTLTALANYRKTILHSEQGLKIAAVLLWKGRMTEEGLHELLDVSLPTLKLELSSLMRANILKTSGSRDWYLSPYGQEILQNLEITKSVTQAIVSTQVDDEFEASFLQASISAQHYQDTNFSLFQTTMARNLAALDLPIADLRSRLYCAAVVGLDPALHTMSCETYLELVISTSHTKQMSFWNDFGDTWRQREEDLVSLCSRAVEDAQRSLDVFFPHGDANLDFTSSLLALSQYGSAIETNYFSEEIRRSLESSDVRSILDTLEDTLEKSSSMLGLDLDASWVESLTGPENTAIEQLTALRDDYLRLGEQLAFPEHNSLRHDLSAIVSKLRKNRYGHLSREESVLAREELEWIERFLDERTLSDDTIPD